MKTNMNTGEIIILVLFAISFCINIAKHGDKKKEEKYNFFKWFFFMAIQITLFYCAGLFHFNN